MIIIVQGETQWDLYLTHLSNTYLSFAVLKHQIICTRVQLKIIFNHQIAVVVYLRILNFKLKYFSSRILCVGVRNNGHNLSYPMWAVTVGS